MTRLLPLLGLLLLLTLIPFGCLSSVNKEPKTILRVPQESQAVTVDGNLDEACYARHAPLTGFVNAADPKARLPLTKAWMFWAPDRFTFAFECEDSTPAYAESTRNERDVDPQDRVELFLWSGEKDRPYYCFEIAPRGAIHDYMARFYRNFDDSWSPTGLTYRTSQTTIGYTVEATITKDALTRIGFALKPGESWHAGVFRADFDELGGAPTWITWAKPKTKHPDFHVASAFGRFILSR